MGVSWPGRHIFPVLFHQHQLLIPICYLGYQHRQSLELCQSSTHDVVLLPALLVHATALANYQSNTLHNIQCSPGVLFILQERLRFWPKTCAKKIILGNH